MGVIVLSSDYRFYSLHTFYVNISNKSDSVADWAVQISMVR